MWHLTVPESWSYVGDGCSSGFENEQRCEARLGSHSDSTEHTSTRYQHSCNIQVIKRTNHNMQDGQRNKGWMSPQNNESHKYNNKQRVSSIRWLEQSSDLNSTESFLHLPINAVLYKQTPHVTAIDKKSKQKPTTIEWRKTSKAIVSKYSNPWQWNLCGI